MTSRKLRRLRGYREVWAIDSEYNWRPSKAHTFPAEPQSDASIQHPVALVGWELYSGRKVRLFEGEFGPEPPFDIGEDVLFIGYNLAAEWQTFLALGWPLPCRALDLFVEYRRHICGIPGVDLNVKGNKRLPKALEHFNISGHTAEEKDEEIALILRGPTPAERERVLTYCESDVEHLEELAQCLLESDCCGEPLRADPKGVAQAVHRGRYSFAVARMIRNAISLDVELLNLVLDNWEEIRLAVIAEQDTFGVYVDGHWSDDRFLALTDELGIDDWPKTTVAERPELEAKKIGHLVARYPMLRPLFELRQTLAELRLDKLDVGADGRNRSSLFPFSTKTGRNAPSGSRYIFGLPKWVRHFIKPAEGMAVAQLDFKNQEYRIAGVSSGDEELLRVIESDDPYIEFAISSNLALPGATKDTHPEIRATCKTLLLGTAYGMGAELFAARANIPLPRAQDIHARLKRTFARYTRWSSFEVVAEARGWHWLHTVFGWRQFMDDTKVTSVRNFPMQATGAEMFRLACCLATERGVRVCGPIHDAMFIEAPTAEIEEAVRVTREAMEEASREVLGGYTIPVEVQIACWPNRFRPDEKESVEMWERVMRLVRVPVLD